MSAFSKKGALLTTGDRGERGECGLRGECSLPWRELRREVAALASETAEMLRSVCAGRLGASMPLLWDLCRRECRVEVSDCTSSIRLFLSVFRAALSALC